MVRVRVRAWVWVRVRVKVRVWVKVRVRVTIRVRIMVKCNYTYRGVYRYFSVLWLGLELGLRRQLESNIQRSLVLYSWGIRSIYG